MQNLKIWVAIVCAATLPVAAAEKPLYENNFEKAEAGKLPEELKFATGDFTVKAEGGNKFLELPGAPLDSFNVQFGPTESADVAVSARIYGTANGRRYPVFGVGGYRLQVSPGKKALELYQDQDVRASVAYDWKPGEWMRFRLQVRKVKDGEWRIEGKAWPAGTSEPAQWMVAFDEKEAPVAGCASVFGNPFSGTPIGFDDLLVERASMTADPR